MIWPENFVPAGSFPLKVGGAGLPGGGVRLMCTQLHGCRKNCTQEFLALGGTVAVSLSCTVAVIAVSKTAKHQY